MAEVTKLGNVVPNPAGPKPLQTDGKQPAPAAPVTSAPVTVPSAPPAAPAVEKSAAPTAAQIVTAWADTLRAKNVPQGVTVPLLSWVRTDKVPELIKLLARGGYK